jgi:hypothetical protein
MVSAMAEEYLRVDGTPKKDKLKKIAQLLGAQPKGRLLQDAIGGARAMS